MAVRVLLVDDVAELRTVVRLALRLRGGFEVVAEAGDGIEAIAQAAEHQPDVTVLDLGLPDLAGHDVLAGIRAGAPQTRVVVYTGGVHDSSDVLKGVEAYVRKDNDVAYLVDLIADLSRERLQIATIELGPGRADVALARRFVRDQCRRWGCEDVIDDGQLVVTELVTNALVHAGGRCELRARLDDRMLRLEVLDDGAGTPDPQAADKNAEHGRGLLLVSALSSAWGVDTRPEGGKVVWAELPSRGDAAPEGSDELEATSH